MSPARSFLSRGWIAALLVALGILVALNLARIDRVEALTGRIEEVPAVDPESPTGYADGVRLLIAPGQNHESYQWIAQTQHMLAQDTWRLRQVDYDNAPVGRAVSSPSAYRWWLAALAGVHRLVTGQPVGLSVERIALWADPLLLMVFLIAGTVFVRRRFGPLAATAFPLAAICLYPFGGTFLPGAPDDVGLSLLLVAGSMLVLVGSVSPRPAASASGGRPGFIASGALGGLALWVNPGVAAPMLLGLGAGGLAAEWLTRRHPGPSLPWRRWSYAGAGTHLLLWLLDYAPGSLRWTELAPVEAHPLFALAWLGGGEVLAQAGAWVRQPGRPARAAVVRAALGAGALALLPLGMLLRESWGFLTRESFASRLTPLRPEFQAADSLAWLIEEPVLGRVLVVVLPLLLLVPALLLVMRQDASASTRQAVLPALGALLVALGLAALQLSWWNHVGALWLVLLVVVLGDRALWNRPAIGSLAGVAALAALPGLFLLLPASRDRELSPAELVALAERDLAHWLARRAGPDGAVALAPPDTTVSLFFHGGIGGLGTPYRENSEGFLAAIRIAGATSPDEAQALMSQRNVTHIVIPPWDPFLDEYARLGANEPEHTLMGLLHRWLPPRWLRPVPYYLPNQPAFADQRLIIFERINLQDDAASLSRLTEYFVETGGLQLAGLAADRLAADFPADLSAQVAKARADLARRDPAGFARAIQAIEAGLQEGAEEYLDWDRRVSLSVVLAEANRIGAARQQVERTLAEMDEPGLRSLSEPILFRFLTLARALEIEIEDPELADLARRLLPPTLRSQL